MLRSREIVNDEKFTESFCVFQSHKEAMR